MASLRHAKSVSGNMTSRSSAFHTTSSYSTGKKNSVALVRERTMPTKQPPFVGEVVPTFADRGCCVVSATDSHGG
jgi:hypothetical protein